jgi:AraC-like DNA-binding protein
LPDGGSEWIFVLGDPLERSRLVLGPGAYASGTAVGACLSRHVGRVLTFGVAFHPGGAGAFVRLPSDRLTGRTVQLERLWGRLAQHLVERLSQAHGFAERVDLVQGVLLQQFRPGDDEVSRALRRLLADPRLPVASLAQDSASARRLQRKFLRHVGVTPKHLARMLRLQAALRLRLDGWERSWTEVADLTGYADQAHMVREFTNLAGAPPGRAIVRELGMSVSFNTGRR